MQLRSSKKMINQFCYLCSNKKVVSTKYGDFCIEHLKNVFKYIKSDLTHKVNIKNQIVKDCLECRENKLCFRHVNQVCSEFFYCETCLDEHNELINGITRYDSLVLCEKHNIEFRPAVEQIYKIFK